MIMTFRPSAILMYEKSKKAMIYTFRTPCKEEGCVLALTSPRFIYRVIVVGTQIVMGRFRQRKLAESYFKRIEANPD